MTAIRTYPNLRHRMATPVYAFAQTLEGVLRKLSVRPWTESG